jgi:sRNA-binding regulator protein Hfq
MSSNVEELLKLAQAEFYPLSETDKKLFRAVAEGKAADFSASVDNQNANNATQVNCEHTINADRIIWLCTNSKAKDFLTYRGIEIVSVTIEEELNLNFVTLEIPLKFIRCNFSSPISLQQARLSYLSFEGSKVVSIDAHEIHIDSSVFLSNGFEAHGEVNLLGAFIHGELNCKRGKFINEAKTALFLRNANITTNVLLTDGFEANGSVNLQGSFIGGSLVCSEGKFFNQEKYALFAQSAKINADVFLNNGFEADGEVNFVGVSIGGSLFCNKAKFSNEGKDKYALIAMSANITANISLSSGFEAYGTVFLTGASIGGFLLCGGGKFFNQEEYALFAQSVNIAADLCLNNGFEAYGQVNLTGISIGGSLLCHSGKFFNKGKYALVAQSAKINADVCLSDGFEAHGEVVLSGASIGGSLLCNRSKFLNEGKNALLALNANIMAAILLSDGFEANGEVNLIGTSIGGSLLCNGGKFSNKDGIAVNISGANIKEDVQFVDNFTAEGIVSFLSAKINNSLYIKSINNSQHMKLDLRFARIGILKDEVKSWPSKGNLYLYGFIYNLISESSPLDSRSRLKWLRLQPKDEFTLQPYEQLASILRSSGHEKDAIKVLIGKQDDQRNYGGLSLYGRVWNYLLGKTIAHGYKPQRALWFSLLFIISGIFIFDLGYKNQLISPSSNVSPFDQTLSEISMNYPSFNPIIYSIDVFLPIIDFHQESHWLPNSKPGSNLSLLWFKVDSGAALRCYFWIHIFAGWVLTSLSVAGFTGLIRSQNN